MKFKEFRDLKGIQINGNPADDVLCDIQLSNTRKTELKLLPDKVIKGIDFSHTLISDYDLSQITFEDCNFSHAFLASSFFWHTKLINCNFSYANLQDVSMFFTEIKGCNFAHADFTNADLTNVCDPEEILTKAIPLACPESGSFIGWKKAIVGESFPVIVKLRIPEYAKRVSGTGNKCRCNKAEVLEIQNRLSGKPIRAVAHSMFDKNFIYETGSYIEAYGFEKNRFYECAAGIHFFMTREEAENYNM